ncbi:MULTISPECIES: ABC transporter ATP-binding protein [Paenibacillus]|jgi:putative ABC transport system ATP-binding protein|uniref:ABC transporter ATP-binding protein n=2 Tax=Paenibacillus barengoltzii TaxID=343517 RepID=R9LGL4_9BACL|nr:MULTISPECIES: ABC transporter ATP-binding protein [Paenibacillus]EOS57924.1 ABC transporter ATP-binding protein [Paenibacillus barengoltzii G22]MDU0329277.1 ABC transporter ATP-binding protein [Paenibacillus sp. 3LSP]MEC2344149.1 ABC transporter ATP-binding protein [Paenibacillus barengoltzii]SMF45294.1 putative ABC transport system ATP-binding protein [Paenibacillus barengoltzii]SMF63595.1 putative ABC transport system ATP-binding protein [Paenibacillus barengoltzii J12]
MMRWLRKKEKVEVQPGADSPVPESAEGETAAAAEKTALAEADAEVIAAHVVQKEEEKETGPILSVKDVRRSFPVGGGEIQVLKGINMEVLSGQLVMLKGRSGSGKTTLLNMLGGLDQPTSGEIWFRGQPLHELNDDKRTLLRRNQIGFIFQAYALLPLLSAWENVELSLRMAGVPPQEWKPRVKHCLELVGLGKRMFHRPFELSGGEQQRVAIAKAIAHRPKLLLADEPTANLDSQMGAQVMAVFKNIIQTERVTICMTTHDPTILEVADHVYEMVDGKFIE